MAHQDQIEIVPGLADFQRLGETERGRTRYPACSKIICLVTSKGWS
jgi:hypothetical protein